MGFLQGCVSAPSLTSKGFFTMAESVKKDLALLAPMFALLSDDTSEIGYVDFDIIHFFRNVLTLRWEGFVWALA